ncbi:type I restriction endonuclease subunit R [Cryobacterium lyxosi]|uniref:Type I restriction enzyme endonuclease subunit n=1 Tax=Cryobacterium lyxosi TaxID=1259228 RepID=A0A4R8ZI31_9MICO|nr:HsdR family type I site-specific deoxyribonuclease [Cryobacterium lyxosi]TFD28668.1 type I restriction endonuclease subunit R [Cryobacterium lyxosi]
MSFSESSTVQAAIIDRLVANHWRYVPGTQLDRSHDSVLIEDELVAAIQRLNPLLADDPDRVDMVVSSLRLVLVNSGDTGMMGANEEFTAWLRGRRTITLNDTNHDEPVHLIDFETPSNNSFIVSDEVTYGVPGSKARFDVVLWVNGIPLVVGETKTPVDHKKSWLHGAKDIRDRYEVERPHFFVPNLLSFATEGREFRYAAIRTPLDYWEQWGDTKTDANLSGWPRVKLAIDELLDQKTLLSVLADYTVFERGERNGLPSVTKIVPRYFQHETVEAIVDRAVAGTPRRGLIYHTQGSGKTLAMSWAAARLIHEPRLKNPTIIAIADRAQLVRQTYNQFLAAGTPRLNEVSSSSELRSLLKANQRGVIFTTIHKFKDAGHLSDRDNIIVLVDEAHRTQEGSLGQQMRTALPNAFLFGFTGTPIADLDRNTFKMFGDENDPDYALNTYNSNRSIADGTTVPMRVSSRMVDFHINQEALDAAADELAKAENLSEEEQEKIAAKISNVATLLANPERIRKVCEDILDHFYPTIDPLGMKAQIVVYNREMCVAYYEQLTAILAERGIEDEATVVMSAAGKDDPASWNQHQLTEQQEEAALNRFRAFGDPLKFLIVTSKLGTGFNAPIEGALYLDKPMKLHTLFQVITRTNRPWSNPVTGQKKAFGLIVDYIGLGNGFARAMTPNNPDAKQRELDLEGLIEAFGEELDALLDRFAGIDRTDVGMDSFQSALERVPLGESRDRFGLQFMLAQSIWETIAPVPELEPRRSDYRWVAKIYEAVTPNDNSALLWDRVGAKTRELVYLNITGINVRNPRLTVQIADSTTVQSLIDAGLIDPDDKETVVKPASEVIDGIAARLKRRLAGANGNHTVYKGLAERLERLRASELARAKDSIEYLRELFTLAKDVKDAEHAEDEDGVDGLDLLPNPNIGALTQIFEEFKPENVPVLIGDVVTEIDRIVIEVSYPGWEIKDDGKREVRKSLLKVFKKFRLPLHGEPFESAYQYVETHY